MRKWSGFLALSLNTTLLWKASRFFENLMLLLFSPHCCCFSVFGASKLCKYNGQHYCFDCHIDDERIVPSRVLFNWDFRRHRVCRASCEFLDSIADSAVLNVEESNPALYMYIPELEEALVSEAFSWCYSVIM